MQYYKITAPKADGPVTVNFLGIFQPGESQYFSEDEIRAWENMNGVPRASALDDDWKVEKTSKKAADEDAAQREQAAQQDQEKAAAALQAEADKPGEGDDK